MKKNILLGIVLSFLNFAFSQTDTTSVDDYLDMDLEALMNIEVVTASKSGEKISDAPATIQVITSEQIKQYGWRDLKDVFRAIPGVDVSYDVQGEIRTIVIMRGILGNQKLLILQDGQRQNPITGERFVYGNNIPLSFYKRIEIVYGPASALYGADAYAGVINLITKDGKDIDGIEVNTGYSSTNAFNGDIIFGKEISDDVDVVMGARIYNGNDFEFHKYYTEAEDYGVVNDYKGALGEESNSYPIKDWNLFTKIKYKKVIIGADWQHEYETNALTTIPVNYAYISKNVWAQDIRHAYVTYNAIEKENFNLSSTVTVGDYTVNPASNFSIVSGDTSSASYGYKYAHSEYVEGLIQASWKISEKLSIISGLSYSLVNSFPKTQNLDGVPFATNGDPVDDLTQFVDDSLGYVFGLVGLKDSLFKVRQYNNFGSFLQAKYSPLKNLSITAGVRYDYNSMYGSTVNPRLGIVYKPLEKMSIKALYGTSYIQPSNYYRWENWANPFAMHIPNQDIKPEQLQTAELSASYYLSKSVSVNAALFRNDMTDMIQPVMAGVQENNYPYYNPMRPLIGEDPSTGYVEINANLGTMYSQGVDLGVNAHFSNILTVLSYSYIDGADENGNKIPKISTHKVNCNVSYSSKKFFAGLTARYYSNIHVGASNSLYGIGGAQEGEEIPGAFILYANAGYNILDNLRFNISVENMLNTKHYGAAPYGESVWIQPRTPQSLLKIYVGLNFKF